MDFQGRDASSGLPRASRRQEGDRRDQGDTEAWRRSLPLMGRLFPEGFHPGEVCMRLLGAVEQLINVGLFRPQQPLRMFPEVVAVGGERLSLRKIVQRAELILQLLQLGQCRLAPLGVLLAGKNAGEELDRVAQVLRPDAQLVAPFDIERAQIYTLLADPFSPAR